MTSHVPECIGIGALNLDMIYEITDDLKVLNAELKSNRIKRLRLGKETYGKPEDSDKTLEIVGKHAKLTSESLGGSAANTIVALSRLGFSTGYLGIVGDDNTARALIQGLEREKVDTTRVFCIRGSNSGICISITNGRDRALRVFPGANDRLSLKHLYERDAFEGYLARTRHIHMTSFVCLQGPGPLELQTRVATQLRRQVRISFSPGHIYLDRLGVKGLLPILRNSDVVFLNEEEAEQVHREKAKLKRGGDYEAGTEVMRKLGPRIVACTRGKKGAFVSWGKERFSVDRVPVPKDQIKPKGLIGAGDYFAGGFLAALLVRGSAKLCADFGNMIAALKLRWRES